MFYAEFCPGKGAYSSTFYAFKTKAERDRYVDINEEDATAISAKQMRCLGRNFKLEESFLELGAYTVKFDRRRLKLPSR